MRAETRRAVADVRLQQFVGTAARGKEAARRAAWADAFGEDIDAVRAHAGALRRHALDHLDVYLERFATRARAAGAHVHVADDAAAARGLCVEIARAAGCRSCVKSKSMVTEEIALLPALEAAGVETLETDLGEYIVQLDDDTPSHIVTPIIHKDRHEVAASVSRALGRSVEADPVTLTKAVREHMRGRYRAADLGITGANFLIAETGSIVVCTNEGNADLSVCSSRVHIAVVGIEKVVPRWADAATLLKLLARSATGQPITVYTSVITGPRRPDEHDGPEALHIVLVDNGRCDLLAEPHRDALRCIRCGACLNTCPVYRSVGGHAYGAVYPGPIGSVITPLLRGVERFGDLPKASSLCGACGEACPVAIDLPEQLVRLREKLVERRVESWTGRVAHRAWAFAMRRPAFHRLMWTVQRRGLRLLGRDGWVRRLPGPLRGWTDHRDFPVPPEESFRDWWQRRSGPPPS
jgi:L-lactate dehydrogenase complex protein LldF